MPKKTITGGEELDRVKTRIESLMAMVRRVQGYQEKRERKN